MTPHRAAAYILQHLGSTYTTISPLTNNQASILYSALLEDARSYFYSAALSIADAIHGVNSSYYAWATVKLYYATFYCLRSFLALDGYAVVYFGNKPILLRAKVGELPSRPRGSRGTNTTHGVIIEVFKRTMPSHYLLSQNIRTDNSLDWLQERRIDMNYRSARMPDPEIPDHFSRMHNHDVRELTSAYLASSSVGYEFDPDHAMLAFPVKAIQLLKNQMVRQGNFTFSTEELNFLCKCYRDKKGILSAFQSIFRP